MWQLFRYGGGGSLTASRIFGVSCRPVCLLVLLFPRLAVADSCPVAGSPLQYSKSVERRAEHTNRSIKWKCTWKMERGRTSNSALRPHSAKKEHNERCTTDRQSPPVVRRTRATRRYPLFAAASRKKKSSRCVRGGGYPSLRSMARMPWRNSCSA